MWIIFSLWKRAFLYPHPLWKLFSYSPRAFSHLSTIFSPTANYYEIYPVLSPSGREKEIGGIHMKFSCEKALLSSAVTVASRAVAAKSSIPAMEGILIEAGAQLKLTGYNLSLIHI